MILIGKPRKIGGDGSEPHWQAVSLFEFLGSVGGRKFAPRERCLDQTVKFPEKSGLPRRGPMPSFDWDAYHLHQVHDLRYLLSRQFSLDAQRLLRSSIVLEFDRAPLSQ